MKKLIFLLALAGQFNFTLKAQYAHCFTEEYTKAEMQRDPQFARNREALERFTEQYTQARQVQSSNRRTSGLPYIIPIVFHILHNYGPENVSDDLIIEAVRLMNLDYRKLNADTTDIVPSFKQIAADCEIEFRLATIDPLGNCTNGIEHIVTQKTYMANDGSKLNPWPNNKYYNIWVANSLQNTGAAAYAYYPGASGAIDGVMCGYTYVNNIGKTLTHEAGHSFNLQHIWGNNNNAGVTCGDDQVGDTPITKGFNNTCDLSASVCNPPIIENVQNYMDYTSCTNMFTTGQKVRMHATLNSTISGRNNLWSSANLIATGTDGSPVNVCVPISDFKSDYSYSCANDSVHFTDHSWKGAVANWNWSFPAGSPATSNLKNPSVAYSAAGIYNATLRVSNASGADSITKVSVVRITAASLNTIPFIESFEDSASFPGNDGFVLNPGGGDTWSRVTNAGATGIASIKMSNYTSASGSVDEWITPSFDFSSINSPVTISFKVANAQRNSTSVDELKLYYSLNCGRSWSSTSYSKSGAGLATAGIVTSNFTPNNPSQWRQETVSVNPVKLKPNVRFKFQNNSNHGNNTYIDDINITGIYNGVNDLDELQTDFSLYPNPTAGVTTVNFSLSKSYNVRLEVKDILGRNVSTVFDETLGVGIHERKLPVLTSGIYLVDITINSKHYVRKLVVS